MLSGILCISLGRDARPFFLDILAFTLVIFASFDVICHDDDVLQRIRNKSETNFEPKLHLTTSS